MGRGGVFCGMDWKMGWKFGIGVHALETTCSGLHDQVSGYEQLKEQIEEFQDAQINTVNEKVAKLDADLLEMACHLEEKIYPYLLTIISRQRWILTHGMKLFLVKCLNSLDYLTALGAAISRAIKQGMQSGLAVGIDHGREGRSLTNVAAYNAVAKADFNIALQKLREPDVEQLRVPIHRSKDQVVLGETSMSFALSVSHSLSAATTTALSTTFASASSIPPITIEDYEIADADGQEGGQKNVQGDAQGNAASFATVEFEKEELDTTPERDPPC
ncbi:hypothetical protein Tco_0566776 [Tanacetum coccineum]